MMQEAGFEHSNSNESEVKHYTKLLKIFGDERIKKHDEFIKLRQ